jgi:hypothetical protein
MLKNAKMLQINEDFIVMIIKIATEIIVLQIIVMVSQRSIIIVMST